MRLLILTQIVKAHLVSLKISLAIILFFAILSCSKFDDHFPANSIQGIVLDQEGPVQGAIIRVQTTKISTTSNEVGQFQLSGMSDTKPIILTAWKPGYYIGGGEEYQPGQSNVKINIVRHPKEDNPAYKWVSAFSSEGSKNNCQTCHADPSNLESNLPFDEWQQDAHASSATNPRFLTMYLGSDIYGNQSARTRYGYNPQYGEFPLRPDPEVPYYGPGYKLDFPTTEGNCGACHTPMAAINDPYGINPSLVSGIGKEGVSCDFCHKVWDVKLNQNEMPAENMPGVLSFEFRRPPNGQQLFTGPLDDVAPGEDIYSPLQSESKFCAPCHTAKFWGVEIYNSFGEWLNSPYSHPETGQTCQDCHMPSGQLDHFARLDKGGKIRDAKTIFSHKMPGATDRTLLQNAVSMDVYTTKKERMLTVQVDIKNDKTGHHIPTGSPLRHLILWVQAHDEMGNVLAFTSGPTLPDWCGQGDSSQGYYAGLPGIAYAKTLKEVWTGIFPTGAYWNMTQITNDNRIPAYGTDQSYYQFDVETSKLITVNVKLIYRQAFKRLQDWKKWDIPDIIMEQKTQTVMF